ncbi:ABC-type glycerol-3-phosphate transport system substrate-binding protein [Haloactinopolyspora alba]|uniref:ABC-type glycerol-3-phosphate transport system substrate-binding protein n=1 Tax=Haloactinopolyspora alba TaxID=648780 RepID=A0A2P8EC30_9ACTN|nr:extracellular solute-binding protein [Haloactinopolyspora alba]PSL07014.1 ABC-type glycerol-3-phosphate transport system substrate-binding protein [Haloactinopolyspora alba]
MSSTRTRLGTVTAAVLALSTVAACGSDNDDGAGSDGDGGSDDAGVTIGVTNLPPSTEKAARKAFLARVKEFEQAHPNIDVEPSEYEWDPATFAAQLAGGTLPTAFQFPFTYGKELIERGQVADLTAEVKSLPYAGDFNPSVLEVVQDESGAIHGVPVEAYGMGLHYNRALFEQAGLDPDKPPQTWDEIRRYADTIADATGQAGYAQMSQNNTGGWILTTQTYAMGGRVEEGSGDDVTATLDNPATRRALETLHAMRWEDDSMGDNFLYEWGTINQAFAAGQVGMYIGGSDVYNSLVTENNVDPETYGLTTIPLDGPDSGVLGGGSIVAVRPDASDAERAAAVKWIDFYYMGKLTEQEAAVADAMSKAESDAPVGTPTLPIFDADQLEQAETWIAEYVNVPLEQMMPFKNGILDQPLIPEPPVKAQELYAELDTVVQAVLNDENADIDALLETANENVSSLLADG